MSINRILASTLQGLVISAGIIWIIFGAIMLLNTLKYSGVEFLQLEEAFLTSAQTEEFK